MRSTGARLGLHLATLSCAVACAILLTLPGESVVPRAPGFEVLEDPTHSVIGLVLTWLALLSARDLSIGQRGAILTVFCYLMLLELIQIPIPGRGFEWWDVLFTVVGIGLGWAAHRRIYSAAGEAP